jgi:hypothetical protein
MVSILRLRGVLNVGFLLLLINNLSFASDLIEPTRTLSGTGSSVGKLSVFSEPQGLEVTLDGKKIGKTPVFSQIVAPGVHVLMVKNAETKISVAPAQNLRLSLYKGSFIEVPEETKEVLGQPDLDGVKTPPKPEAEQPAPKKAEFYPRYWPFNPRGPIN